MIKKQQQFILKGMNQDIAETKVQSDFAYKIKNLRVVTDESDGMLSLVTEKGTLEKTIQLTEEKIEYVAPSRIDITNVMTWNSGSGLNYRTIDLDQYIDLCYRTHVNIIEITFTFPQGTNIDSSNVGYTFDTFKKYFSLPKFDENIDLKYNDAYLYFDLNNWKYNILKINGDTLSEYVDFKVNGPQDDATWESFHLWEFRCTENNIVKITIPVFEFEYAINNTPSEITTINDGSTIIEQYLLAFKSQLGMFTRWNNIRTITIKNILGNAILKNDLVIFGKTTTNHDYIGKIKNINSNNPITEILYSGDLNFNENNPIKTLVSYESENQQRVYWIDGLNQPRVINIKDGKTYEFFDNDIDNHFNFCTPIYCNEIITIDKKSIGGLFHSGVIQYFMTYIDQNDQESKIFYASHLYYITDNNRALSPDEMSTNSFVLNLGNINANDLLRKKLRIYSLQRTSLDATPIAKLVYELKLTEKTSSLTIVDTGNIGSNIDPQILLLLGCDEFVPQTMAVKDNTIFFGNIEAKNYQHINDTIANNFIQPVAINTRKLVHEYVPVNYSTSFQLNGYDVSENYVRKNKNGNDNDIKGFMYNEEYMLGLQFLHKSGEWSEPIWVGDFIMTEAPYRDSNTSYQFVPYFYKSYGYSYFAQLIELGYIAVRPLVVFNDKQNCRVLCQGVINPTIEYTRTNCYYPSWFFRYANTGSADDSSSPVDFQNIEDNFYRRTSTLDTYPVHGEVQGFDQKFIIRNNLITFNSPEIEFEKITSISNDNYTLRRIGWSHVHADNYDILMTTSTSTYKDKAEYGLIAKRDTIWYSNARRTFVGGFCWKDKNFVGASAEITATSDGGHTVTGHVEVDDCIYYVWPWENNQSYSCAPKTDEDIVYSAPDKKTISNYRFSGYFEKNTIRDYEINSINIANNSYIRTKISDNSDKEYSYLKDVDLLVTGTLDTPSVAQTRGNCIYLYKDFEGEWHEDAKNTESGCNIVRIQYKTTPHVIMQVSKDEDNHDVLYYANDSGLQYNYGAIAVCELINKSYNETTKFKGRLNGKPTDTSMYENTWYVAGDVVKLPTNPYGAIGVEWTKGDTYYQRYDCLKTYPFSHEAKNSIIDVLSCMIQTRINLDGRYDKNRCVDILHIDPTNFNKLNDVYSQTDNFFTYHKLDPERFQNVFPNLITWSKRKLFGESTDSWANIHLVNVLDLDGDLGKITSIKLWNNRLIAFQDKGISVIKYNENAMISQSAGAPIELLNSGLVTGKEYITNQFGCQNEWSIVNAKTGLYFSDDYNHKLYVISDGIKCISDNLGFKSYLKTKNYAGAWKPNTNTWTLANGGTLHTFYDQQLGEIYFTDGEDCLTFNENLNLFTAFYDYRNDANKKLFDFVNIENKNYWILNNFTSNTPVFYEHRATDYLNIFNTNRDYSIELTSNIDPRLDKVFDTVEIRGDCWHDVYVNVTNDETITNPKESNCYEIIDNEYVETTDTTKQSGKPYYQIQNRLQTGYSDNTITPSTTPPFDTLKATNEYQNTGDQQLSFVKDRPSNISNIKQKFRIWRAQIGRDATNARDRIRNYWSRIKLTKTATNNLRAKIHDIIVNVYE